MLSTPLGNIEISIDGNPIDYTFNEVALDELCKDLYGRCSITVHFCPDGKEHVISCRIKPYTVSGDEYIESGERLELKSFLKGGIKLSIGIEGDTGYVDGKRLSEYDYDGNYLDDGVEYLVLPFTKTEKYVFGIAWTDDSDEHDVQTWFGADPTYY